MTGDVRPVDGYEIVRRAIAWRTIIRTTLAKTVITEDDTNAAHDAYDSLIEAIDSRISS